jgi:hypothetical protein
MKYVTGEEVEVGDQVLIENGKTEGVVHAVVETLTQMQEWGVDEPGLSIKSAPFGLVFWPSSETEDPVIFKGRLEGIKKFEN